MGITGGEPHRRLGEGDGSGTLHAIGAEVAEDGAICLAAAANGGRGCAPRVAPDFEDVAEVGGEFDPEVDFEARVAVVGDAEGFDEAAGHRTAAAHHERLRGHGVASRIAEGTIGEDGAERGLGVAGIEEDRWHAPEREPEARKVPRVAHVEPRGGLAAGVDIAAGEAEDGNAAVAEHGEVRDVAAGMGLFADREPARALLQFGCRHRPARQFADAAAMTGTERAAATAGGAAADGSPVAPPSSFR